MEEGRRRGRRTQPRGTIALTGSALIGVFQTLSAGNAGHLVPGESSDRVALEMRLSLVRGRQSSARRDDEGSDARRRHDASGDSRPIRPTGGHWPQRQRSSLSPQSTFAPPTSVNHRPRRVPGKVDRGQERSGHLRALGSHLNSLVLVLVLVPCVSAALPRCTCNLDQAARNLQARRATRRERNDEMHEKSVASTRVRGRSLPGATVVIVVILISVV